MSLILACFVFCAHNPSILDGPKLSWYRHRTTDTVDIPPKNFTQPLLSGLCFLSFLSISLLIYYILPLRSLSPFIPNQTILPVLLCPRWCRVSLITTKALRLERTSWHQLKGSSFFSMLLWILMPILLIYNGDHMAPCVSNTFAFLKLRN